MAYKIFQTDKIYAEIKLKNKLINIEKPIINQYYNEVRSKIKPTIQELPPNPDENQIRNILTNELSPILKSQTSNFIEKLKNSNDLLAFHKFSTAFINTIKDIRYLDSNFLYDLWSKYKSKMLSSNNKIEEEEKHAIPVVQPINVPFGTTARGSPRSKPGRKPKNEGLLEQLKNSPQFKARQAQNVVPTLNLTGHGIHHHTLKMTVGRGIAGETYVARR